MRKRISNNYLIIRGCKYFDEKGQRSELSHSAYIPCGFNYW
ncbi:hypothetical protein NC651_016723 [Populus alba x Populus x berolinensis]|nr:hypothetical protein NC651_016723 [Populus alba x Populus x berolinensis]